MMFREVFEILINQFGILPVVAVGNENHGNSSSPGNASTAFSVGAVEKVRGGKVDVAFFSSGASMVFPGDEPHALGTKPDVVALGVQVFSCIPPEKRPDGIYEYTYMDGTSMATPHVAGIAALLMAAKPKAPVTDIMNVLKETARHPLGTERRPDNRWGMGSFTPWRRLRRLINHCCSDKQMAHGHKDSMDDKISRTFKMRLKHLEPKQKVHAIVVLHLNDHEVAPGRRQSPAERQAAIEGMRKSAEPALGEIDRVLRHFDGKRLASSVNALRSIPVEATPDGIAALTTLDSVKAILEDQLFSLLPGPRK